ncbi:MAG: DUF808 domain-containing protein [Epsilonproteobacteria bacterium]|nr:DUF808 domain-containing protein [Campylobacterota bacterium]
MASSFFALLDDIAYLMDDIATATKSATKHTAGILGDDLAVNAAKASRFSSSKELPLLWAIVKGSFLNKIILIPIIIFLSYFFKGLIIPILIAGGAYLAYEGVEGVWDYIMGHEESLTEAKDDDSKVKEAIITDFILSIEIVLIALSSVINEDLTTQIIVVTIVSFLATIGVYGIVAFLVRLDDMGFAIAKGEEKSSFKYRFGIFLVKLLPYIIRILKVVGIVAMLLVAGSIFIEHISYFEEIRELLKMPLIISELLASIVVGGFGMLFVYIIKKFIALFK